MKTFLKSTAFNLLLLVLFLAVVTAGLVWNYFLRGPRIVSVSRMQDEIWGPVLVIQLTGPPFMKDKMKDYEYSPIHIVSGDGRYKSSDPSDIARIIAENGAINGSMELRFKGIPNNISDPALVMDGYAPLPFREEAASGQ